MSTYVSMPDGPAPVANIGTQLKTLAADFGKQAKGINDEITSIDGGKPWGQDETGTTFAASYNQVPPGPDGKPFSTSLHDELADAGTPLDTISDNILGAVANYQITDVDSSNAINNV
jgi:hypothetical protein